MEVPSQGPQAQCYQLLGCQSRIMADNGSVCIDCGKKPHRKDETPNGNEVRLFNWDFSRKNLSSQVFYQDSHTNPYILLVSLALSLGHQWFL